MSTPTKPSPGDHYRELAAAAAAAGAATELPHVRIKHELAAQRWTVLAEAEDVRAAEQDRRHAIRRDRIAAEEGVEEPAEEPAEEPEEA